MVTKFLGELVMGEPPIRIIEINQVWNNVIKVIEDAEEKLVLVSPYNDYSVPLKEALTKAAGENVVITAVCREEQKQQEGKHFEWLRGIGADVYLVERLHAKIYYNESTAVVTSMNLLKGSATDSKEIGFIIKDARLRDQIREYVQKNLITHSTLIAPLRNTPNPKTPAARPPKAEPKQAPRRQTQRPSCIRCGEEKARYNLGRPLCLKCYDSWKVHGGIRTSSENYCHRCGKKEKTSFAKPLCSTCSKEAANVR